MLHTKREEMEKDRENIAYRIIRQGQKSDKPIVVSVNAGTMYNVFVETLDEGGIPTYSTAERAMTALNRLVEDKLKRGEKMTEFKCPNCGSTLTVLSKEAPTVEVNVTVEYVKDLFPKTLEEMLSFNETQKYVTVKPRQYLGKENFAKIASVIREAGGEYVSAGKESHFRVEKK